MASRRLETLANVMTIVAGAAVALALADRFLLRANAPSISTPLYAAGEKLNAGKEIDFSKSSRTLMVVVDPTCGICTSSMPFFKQLVSASHESPTRIIFASKKPTEELNRYLGEHGITGVDIQSISPQSIRVKAVPTLMLADSQGRFIKAWIGGQPSPAQEEILKLVKAN